MGGLGLGYNLPEKKKTVAEMTPDEQGDYAAQQMVDFMKSCPGKTAIAGVTGYFLGGFFGLFMASMSYDVPGATPYQDLPFKKQMKVMFADMGKRMSSSARNFGYIGAIYSGCECVIESIRAKNDIYNGLSAGCLTGGGLAIKAGPTATLLGCGGFAAFSAAIDMYMRQESNPPPKNDYDL